MKRNVNLFYYLKFIRSELLFITKTLFVLFEKMTCQRVALNFIRATKTNDQSSPSAVVSKSTNNLFNYLIKLP